MKEELKRLWTWKSYKLMILDFGIFNIRTSRDSFELAITIKESAGEKTVSYAWNLKELEKFYQEIKGFNSHVAKTKDFKDKMIVYNCGERKMQTSLYFKVSQWQKFFNLAEEAYKNYLDQRKIFGGF